MGLLFDSYIPDILVTLATLAYVIYAFFTSTFNHWKDRGIPYKKPTFFFGNMKEQVLGKITFFDFHQGIYSEMSDSKIAGFFQFKQPTLMIRDPELVEKVLIKDFTSFPDHGIPYDLEAEPLTGHLFNVGGKYWRNLRYKMTPTFTTGKIKSMFEQIFNCADDLIKYIESKSETESPFEAKLLVNRFSTDVIASCAFGLQFNSDSEDGIRFREMIKVAFRPSKLQLLRFVLLSMYPNLSKWLRITSIPAGVSEYFINISKETVRYRKENNVNRSDFLQLMIDLQEQEEKGKNMDITIDDRYEEDAIINQLEHVPEYDKTDSDKTKMFTDECIAAQSFVFLAAGSESVSAAISFCLYAIAANPHVHERLQNEVDTVLEKHNGKWSYQAIKEMKYLDQVNNEAQRLYPVIGFLIRKCIRPFKVPNTKHVIEPDTRIVIPVQCLHLDEKFFPNPHVFDPERFAEGNHIQKGTYLPFGDGPRICIAMRFAQLEFKVCVARIISEFNIRVNKKTLEPIQYAPDMFILQAVGGLWLEFDRRKKT